jgi:hypothetical protein
LNTPKNTINAFGTINQVTKEGWPRIPRWQVDGKLVRTLNNGGSNDQPLVRELFQTTLSPTLVNIITLPT